MGHIQQDAGELELVLDDEDDSVARAGGIARLIDRPRPVPPKRRLVPMSACWKGSKMTRNLSPAMPMPVSVIEKAITDSARLRLVLSLLQPSRAEAIRKLTLPSSVNLKALDRRLRRTCCNRLASVKIDSGRPSASSMSNCKSLLSATGRKVRST